MKYLSKYYLVIPFFFCVLVSLKTFAVTHDLPPSLAPKVLADTKPFTFNPTSFSEQDFSVSWIDQGIEGVEFSLGKNSLDWVRVADVLVLPRGRLRLKVTSLNSGHVFHNGFNQPFLVDEKKNGRVEVPVAFISGQKNPINVTINRDGKEYSGKLQIMFHQKSSDSDRLLYDSTCSPFWLDASESNIGKDSWAMVGCRLVYSQGKDYLVPSLELFVFWDNVGQEILIDGARVASSSVSVWPLRMRSQPGTVELVAGEKKIKLKYSVPPRLRLGFFGLGIGPYTYSYIPEGDFPGNNINTTTALATLYGSLFFTEAIRVVMFSALPIHSKLFVDTGVYVLLEQARVFDTRLSIRLLLGGHLLAFPYRNGAHFKFSFPQGVEMVYQEFLARRHYLSIGAFLYPVAGDRSYFNVWLRIGKPGLFGEINYISWQEPFDTGNVKAEVLGISIGFPLFQFM